MKTMTTISPYGTKRRKPMTPTIMVIVLLVVIVAVFVMIFGKQEPVPQLFAPVELTAEQRHQRELLNFALSGGRRWRSYA